MQSSAPFGYRPERLSHEAVSGDQSRRRWYVLAVLTAVYVFNIADRYVLSTLIEPIKKELHLTDTAIGFLTGTALAIFYTGMGIPLGMLADRVERRKLIAISIGVWSVMTAACGAVTSFTQLLLARIGVGTGEAGGTPASQSVLADLFPFSERVLATSIFSLGAAAGSMLGSTAGGTISDIFGWRAAFLALALPGLALAILVRFTTFEPERGRLDAAAESATPTLKETLRFIRTQRSLLHVFAGAAVLTYWGWGLLWWTPAFLMRAHGLSTGEAGRLIGVITGIGGALGIIAGGSLILWLERRDRRWQAWLVSLAAFAGTFASIAAYAAGSLRIASTMLWLFVPIAYLYIPPILSLTQSLVLPRMRGLSCAILLFGANVANLALAPQIIGILSDALLARGFTSAQSLRGALIMTTVTGFWAAYHFWAAGRHVERDLVRAGVP